MWYLLFFQHTPLLSLLVCSLKNKDKSQTKTKANKSQKSVNSDNLNLVFENCHLSLYDLLAEMKGVFKIKLSGTENYSNWKLY